MKECRYPYSKLFSFRGIIKAFVFGFSSIFILESSY
jgi:hypothetical protein